MLLFFSIMSVPSNADLLPETSELDIKNILLLDDDTDLADTLKALLEAHNFVVTTANDGVAGLREVMAMDFDVIICDMLMPGMPGDMFYLAAKTVKPAMADRFLFITGHRGDAKIESFLRSIDAVVVFKPVLTEELVRMISLVLRQTAAR
jgi:DNA-binding response OmpR family regulator